MMLENEAAPESAMKQAEEEAAEPVYLLNWVSIGGKGSAGGGGIGGGGSIAGDFAVGLGGGPVETYAEDTVLDEPLQAEDLLEPTEAASMLSEEKITVEPLIFGVREDELGQVIAVQPDEATVPSVAASREAVEAEKEPLIATNIKLILAGLAAAFGLIYLILKSRR